MIRPHSSWIATVSQLIEYWDCCFQQSSQGVLVGSNPFKGAFVSFLYLPEGSACAGPFYISYDVL